MDQYFQVIWPSSKDIKATIVFGTHGRCKPLMVYSISKYLILKRNMKWFEERVNISVPNKKCLLHFLNSGGIFDIQNQYESVGSFQH